MIAEVICSIAFKSFIYGLCLLGFTWLLKELTMGICSHEESLKGKVILITGGHEGVGLETVVEIAKRGAKIIIGGPKISNVKEIVLTRVPDADVEVMWLDLSSNDRIRHFAKEILAVAESVNLFSSHRPYKPVICGHSLGGWMSATAGYIAKEKVSGVIMIDSPIRPPTFDYSRHRGSGPIRKIKTYPTKEAILERFRLAPEQPCKNKFILDYIANWSIKKVKKGFEWKFDDTLFEKLQPARGDREVAFKLDCNLGIK